MKLKKCKSAFCPAARQNSKHVFRFTSDPEIQKLLVQKSRYPAAKFLVFTDTHFFDESLGLNSPDFLKHLHPAEMFSRDGQKVIPAALEEYSCRFCAYVRRPEPSG
jgi:hypothetical protein